MQDNTTAQPLRFKTGELVHSADTSTTDISPEELFGIVDKVEAVAADVAAVDSYAAAKFTAYQLLTAGAAHLRGAAAQLLELQEFQKARKAQQECQQEAAVEKTFPRKVVISPGYGAGLVTSWTCEKRYEMIECPALVAVCESGGTWSQAQDALVISGFDPDAVHHLYSGGWGGAIAVEVHGPYIVEEYDGFESVAERNKIGWRE